MFDSMRRVGRNRGGYFGERIELSRVLDSAFEVAGKGGWRRETLNEEPGIWGFVRGDSNPRKRVYISAGIHGDEPAGLVAAAGLLRASFWPQDFGVWICPCLNPTGFKLNQREAEHGLDLNRQYRDLEAPETRAHIAWIDRQPTFDMAICLHEDWEANGFYLYELARIIPEGWAENLIQCASCHVPIDGASEIEGRPANGGVIRPSTDPLSRPQWPEAFYLFTKKTELCYTLESPSDFELEARVRALQAAVKGAVDKLVRM